MDFVIQWLCYLAAFVAGSVVAGVIANPAVTRRGGEQVSLPTAGPRVVGDGDEGEGDW
ncbi:MAG: hypothetical protein WCI78_11360 [Mycobacterium sp.]